MSTQLSKNFTFEEMIKSQTAKVKGINNTPTPEVRKNIEKLVNDILQPIRDAYGHPISINSCYRSPKLNAAVGGAKSSQHLTGSAADISCSATSKAELFNLIHTMIKTGKIKVGQLIWEYGTKKEPRWIHVSLPYSKVNNILYLFS